MKSVSEACGYCTTELHLIAIVILYTDKAQKQD